MFSLTYSQQTHATVAKFILYLYYIYYFVDQIVIAYPPIDTEVIVNETAFMQCDVSHPYFVDLVFHWLFNGKPLILENNPQYSTVST